MVVEKNKKWLHPNVRTLLYLHTLQAWFQEVSWGRPNPRLIQSTGDFTVLIIHNSLWYRRDVVFWVFKTLLTWIVNARNNSRPHHDTEICRSTFLETQANVVVFHPVYQRLIFALQSHWLTDFMLWQWTHQSVEMDLAKADEETQRTMA